MRDDATGIMMRCRVLLDGLDHFASLPEFLNEVDDVLVAYGEGRSVDKGDVLGENLAAGVAFPAWVEFGRVFDPDAVETGRAVVGGLVVAGHGRFFV